MQSLRTPVQQQPPPVDNDHIKNSAKLSDLLNVCDSSVFSTFSKSKQAKIRNKILKLIGEGSEDSDSLSD